jgi:hypothetical protein
MQRRHHWWTAAEIETLKTLVALNHSNAMIAKAFGRRSESVRRKCLQLGIMPRPRKQTKEAKCTIDRETMDGLVAAAQRYQFPHLAKFLRELLVTINRDDLYIAVLDQPPAKPRRIMKTYKRPGAIPRPTFVPLAPQLIGSLTPIAVTASI